MKLHLPFRRWIPAFAGMTILLSLAVPSRAQDTVNPYNLAQPMTIELHNTDVYYCPVEPPALYDTRALLCTPSSILRDSNSIFETDPYYDPITHDTEFQYFYPCSKHWGGQFDRIWQRLFTAKRKADGTPSDIIAGGETGDRVTISANEDVDFRASGRIKLKSGFHAKPGCFFHAYTEPTWGSTVFTDDFNGSSIDTTQWYVANGSNAESGGIEALSDSNVSIVNDSQASDGKALDIILREDTNKFSCRRLTSRWIDSCNGVLSIDTSVYQSEFSGALLRTCPWPFVNRTDSLPLQMAYQHMPYGKYEIREKTPHIPHHTNNWLYGSFEIDMNEEMFTNQQILHPNIHHHIHTGPDTGHFHIIPDSIGSLDSTVVFVSQDADWCPANRPDFLFINNFAYDVAPRGLKDTAVGTVGMIGGTRNWPSSLKYSTAPITFYYSYNDTCFADISMTWHAYPDDSGRYRVIMAPYHVNRFGDTLKFSKNYQPTQITLTTGIHQTKTLNCYWDSSLNASGDTGGLLLKDTELSPPADLISNTEAFSYSVDDHDGEYEPAAVAFDWGDTAVSSYQYHTFGIELLPNELRYLIDSAVVLRVPDRLIPPGTRQYDLVKNLDRSPMNFYVGEFDMDPNHPSSDPFGTDSSYVTYPPDTTKYYTSTTYYERKYFEHAAANGWAGCWPVTIGGHTYPTAHKLIDYVHVWDVPAGTPIPNFPN